MRLHDGDVNPMSSVYLGLTDDEARDLIGALRALTHAPKGWHQHVFDATYQCEITVYREDDETATFGGRDPPR